MTHVEIQRALSDGSGVGTLSIKELANITAFVRVSLEMDRSSLSYYHQIDLDELASSKMPRDELKTLKEQGWKIKDGKLILYLT